MRLPAIESPAFPSAPKYSHQVWVMTVDLFLLTRETCQATHFLMPLCFQRRRGCQPPRLEFLNGQCNMLCYFSLTVLREGGFFVVVVFGFNFQKVISSYDFHRFFNLFGVFSVSWIIVFILFSINLDLKKFIFIILNYVYMHKAGPCTQVQGPTWVKGISTPWAVTPECEPPSMGAGN